MTDYGDEVYRLVIEYKTDYGSEGRYRVERMIVGPHTKVATVKGQMTRTKDTYPLSYYNANRLSGGVLKHAEILSMTWEKGIRQWSEHTI